MLNQEKDINFYHKQKMIKKQAAREKIEAKATQKKGLFIIHTGKGKGKSSAAFGMVMRALAHNMRIGVIQFVKGSRLTGERLILEKFPEQVTFYAKGEGFSWETQDRERDIFLAKQAWLFAKMIIQDKSYDFVLLDELNIVLRYHYLNLEEVLSVIEKRPYLQHIVVTGRNASEHLIEKADLVTNMELIKHPFKKGIKAQKGIEF